MRPGNAPWSPELLAYLSSELVSHHYDLKHVYRLILNSDSALFGGHGRLDESSVHTSIFNPADNTHTLKIYNINRSVQVFERVMPVKADQ